MKKRVVNKLFRKAAKAGGIQIDLIIGKRLVTYTGRMNMDQSSCLPIETRMVNLALLNIQPTEATTLLTLTNYIYNAGQTMAGNF